jgi:hypothetical protein
LLVIASVMASSTWMTATKTTMPTAQMGGGHYVQDVDAAGVDGCLKAREVGW